MVRLRGEVKMMDGVGRGGMWELSREGMVEHWASPSEVNTGSGIV